MRSTIQDAPESVRRDTPECVISDTPASVRSHGERRERERFTRDEIRRKYERMRSDEHSSPREPSRSFVGPERRFEIRDVDFCRSLRIMNDRESERESFLRQYGGDDYNVQIPSPKAKKQTRSKTIRSSQRPDKGKQHEETSSSSPAQQVHRVAIRPVRPPISHSDECNYEYRRGSSFGCMDFSCKWKHPHAGRPGAGVASVIAARRSDANRRLPKRLQIRGGQGGKRRKQRKRMLELQRKLPDRVTVPMFETVPSPTRFVAICARHPPVRSS